MERAKAKGLLLDPSGWGGGPDDDAAHVIKFKVERRVSSDDLMLGDVSAVKTDGPMNWLTAPCD